MLQNSLREGIEACLECMNACNYCYISNLKEFELAELRECIRLDRETADICGFTASAISRGTPYLREICELCAKVCRDCAKECSKHKHFHCEQCAAICIRCADICQAIASSS